MANVSVPLPQGVMALGSTGGPSPDAKAKARANAVDFEAMFLSTMFNNMFTSIDRVDLHDILGKINTNTGNCVHDFPLPQLCNGYHDGTGRSRCQGMGAPYQFRRRRLTFPSSCM